MKFQNMFLAFVISFERVSAMLFSRFTSPTTVKDSSLRQNPADEEEASSGYDEELVAFYPFSGKSSENGAEFIGFGGKKGTKKCSGNCEDGALFADDSGGSSNVFEKSDGEPAFFGYGEDDKEKASEFFSFGDGKDKSSSESGSETKKKDATPQDKSDVKMK